MSTNNARFPFLKKTQRNKREIEKGKPENLQAMATSCLLCFCIVLTLFHFTTCLTPSIGVTYPALPFTDDRAPVKIPSTFFGRKVTHVRLADSHPSLIKYFASTNTSLFLSIPNTFLPAMAADYPVALLWVYTHVASHPESKIKLISVGELSGEKDDYTSVIPAIWNVHRALQTLGLNTTKVSTTLSFSSTITTANPPSSAQFIEPATEPMIKPLLHFLNQTKSPFLINIHPYQLFQEVEILPVAFALFKKYPLNFLEDPLTRLKYFNLFDMMVDAVISALAGAGYKDVAIVVLETGWPVTGGAGEFEANRKFYNMYVEGLIGHLKSGVGTPLKKQAISEVYVLIDTAGWSSFPNMTGKRAAVIAGLVSLGFIIKKWFM
ncbi:Glycoside hydrolase, family 17 [Corchorus capsularis]|uniref:glucan endo-1,3-beta-D-glucosidase n=1 Tax=Corchorus capsularis TaxID=210143 RepID=A0A1R3ID66_COCAP|nr:Glycoside hydrolase, family 17 [Corchorus capsularis]